MTADALVIQQLADDVARLEADLCAYRLLGLSALDQLTIAYRAHEALARKYGRLRDEMVRYTAARVA